MAVVRVGTKQVSAAVGTLVDGQLHMRVETISQSQRVSRRLILRDPLEHTALEELAIFTCGAKCIKSGRHGLGHWSRAVGAAKVKVDGSPDLLCPGQLGRIMAHAQSRNSRASTPHEAKPLPACHSNICRGQAGGILVYYRDADNEGPSK